MSNMGILWVVLWLGAAVIWCLFFFTLRRPSPPNAKTMRDWIELFTQLTDEQREAELAILRERVKAHKARKP